MAELEKKIYSQWAFSENEFKKRDINYAIYNEIKDKAKLKCIGTGYAHKVYEIVSNPENLSYDELALIADEGNLCFGYRLEDSNIVIHTD